MRLCDEGDERVLESEVMDSEVMLRNVSLSSSESFEYLPSVKGTSDENERVSVLERVMEVVSQNEHCLALNIVNFGRSNQSKLKSNT